MLSIGKNLTAEQRVEKAIVSLMGEPRYSALAGVLLIGDRKVCDDVPTACTNGRDEMYGRAFVDGLTDAELRGVILHENYHKLYRHLTIWRHLYDKNPRRANMANDYVINSKIARENPDGYAVLPDSALLDSKYDDMGSDQVFDLLSEDDDEEQSSDGDGDSGGFDDHDWEGAQDLSEAEQRELERELDEAIRQGALAAGKMGTGGEKLVADLLEPQINWRETLREFITDTCSGSDYSTWARPNRRYRSAGVYLPSGVSEQVGELVIAIDTSGSIGQVELTAFLSEVKSICDTVHPSSVRILYWDTEVCADEHYEMHELDSLTRSTKPVGGGGTTVECVPAYLTDNNISAQAVIVLTDGYLGGSWGNWSQPLLWCVLDHKSAQPDVGKCVHIKSRDI